MKLFDPPSTVSFPRPAEIPYSASLKVLRAVDGIIAPAQNYLVLNPPVQA